VSRTFTQDIFHVFDEILTEKFQEMGIELRGEKNINKNDLTTD